METDFAQFQAFAQNRLKQAAYKTDPDSQKSRLFHISLISAIQHCQWTKGARDARGRAFRLVAGYIDETTPNALADCYEGVHYMGMHSPLFPAINEFAMFCFTQADFFPDAGDPSKEHSPAPWNDQVPGLWLLDHTKQGGRVDERHSQQLTPRNDERYHMSLYLAFLMNRFVWLHELSHCFNGHVGFVHEHDLALRLYEIAEELPAIEVESAESSTERSDILKCLEFDADQSAFWASCNIQLHGLENIEGIRLLDVGLRMRLTLFGAYAMTWLFEQFQNYHNSQKGRTHPEPLWRLSYLLQTAQNELIPRHEGLSPLNDDVLAQFDTIAQRIPSIYHSASLKELSKEGLEISAISDFKERMAEQKKTLGNFQFSEKR